MSAKRTFFPGLQRIFRVVERGLAVVGLLAIVYHGGFNISSMISGSMAPTLQGNSLTDGDVILSERHSYRFRHPHQ